MKRLIFTLGYLCLLCFPLAAAPAPQHKVQTDKKGRDYDVRQVIKEFVESVRRGAVAKAYQTYTTSSFREQTALDQFYEFVARYPSLNRNRSLEIISVTYHENVASVTVSLTSIEHKNNLATFAVTYLDGRWRILGITVHPSGTSPQ